MSTFNSAEFIANKKLLDLEWRFSSMDLLLNCKLLLQTLLVNHTVTAFYN